MFKNTGSTFFKVAAIAAAMDNVAGVQMDGVEMVEREKVEHEQMEMKMGAAFVTKHFAEYQPRAGGGTVQTRRTRASRVAAPTG